MNPWTKANKADHYATAAKARKKPGVWHLAHTYRSMYSAAAMVRSVRTGYRLIAYRPTLQGRFQARTKMTDTATELWVRFMSADTPEGQVKNLRALAAGLHWLYGTEQPHGAIVSHHGLTLMGNHNRSYRFVPKGQQGDPVVVVRVDEVDWLEDAIGRTPANPLKLDELTDLSYALTALGAEVGSTWNGHPGITGSVALKKPAHPTLLAAVARSKAGCTDHPDRGVLCRCGWSGPGLELAVTPALTAGGAR